MARLGDVFECQITGEWGNECSENEIGTKVLRTTNFTPEGIINYDDVVIRSINETKVEKKRLRYGDIILEKSGGTEKTPVGRVVFCDESIEKGIYLCNNFTQAMRVNQDIAIPRYVFYVMWNLHYSGRTDLLQNKTTGIRNLQVKSYLNENCPIPPLDEQRKIAAVLDKVSDLIAKRRQQLDKLDELVKAKFVEMFGDPVSNPKGWQLVPLGECVTTIDNGKSFVCSNETRKNEWPAILKLSAVTYGEYNSNENKALLDSSQFIENAEVHSGDLLFTRKNTPELVGMAAYVYSSPAKLMMPDLIFRLNTKDNCSKIFLWQLINHELFRKNIQNIASGSAKSMSNISKERLMQLVIYLPPIKLQNHFAAFVEQTEKTKTTISKSLEKLETLKKALMQECFG